MHRVVQAEDCLAWASKQSSWNMSVTPTRAVFPIGSSGGASNSAARLWWEESQTWFSPAFRADVDNLCANLSDEAAKSGPRLSNA